LARIHPTAIVDRHAELGADVEIGPYAVIHAGVRIGARCRVHSFAVLGDLPQDKRGGDKPTRVEIGDDNVFREHVTVHRGTRDSITKIGSNNLFMVGCHVAHDVTIGSRCVIANSVQLAGHSIVEDYATFGGLDEFDKNFNFWRRLSCTRCRRLSSCAVSRASCQWRSSMRACASSSASRKC